MARIIKKRPSPAMIVAIIALVLATAGTSYAISGGLKNTFGTGPLVYSTSNQFIPAGQVQSVAVNCPRNLHPVGGGIRLSTGAQAIEGTVDSFPTRNGWRGTVANVNANGLPSSESHTAVVTAICAKSPQIRGTVAGF
jgi:hypothetical protein